MKPLRLSLIIGLFMCVASCQQHRYPHGQSLNPSINSLDQKSEDIELDGLFDDPYYDSISMITGIAPGSPYWYDPSWGLSYSETMDTLRYYPRDLKDAHFTIPASVRVIEERAFQCNKYLQDITIPESVKVIGVGAFLWSQKLRSVIILGKVEQIPWRAFEGCLVLSTIELSEGVNYIDGFAFSGCENLSLIIIQNPEPPELAYCEVNNEGNIDPEWPFAGVDTNRCIVRVPPGSAQRYREAPGWEEFKQIKENISF